MRYYPLAKFEQGISDTFDNWKIFLVCQRAKAETETRPSDFVRDKRWRICTFHAHWAWKYVRLLLSSAFFTLPVLSVLSNLCARLLLPSGSGLSHCCHILVLRNSINFALQCNRSNKKVEVGCQNSQQFMISPTNFMHICAMTGMHNHNPGMLHMYVHSNSLICGLERWLW